jgi:uncharacterized membrane protein
METRLRSVAKAVSWRANATVILGIISYLFTRDLKETTFITVVYHVLVTFLYYLHERIWARISWGRLRHPLACFPVKDGLSRADLEAIEELLRRRKCLKEPEYQI